MSIQILSPAELYDSVGTGYEEAFSSYKTHTESLEWLQSQLASKPGSKILDIGCGTGTPTCSTLASLGHQVHGIDVSEVMLTRARQTVPQATFDRIDVDEFTCPPNTYDAVTVYFSFMTVNSQATIRTRIRRVHEWLKPAGLLVFATVPEDLDHGLGTWLGRNFVASSMETDRFLECFREVGFEVVDVKQDRFLPRAVEAGICEPGKVTEEKHLWIFARKGKEA